MGRSLKVGSVRGIDIRLHITFPLIVLWAALDWGAGSSLAWQGALYGAEMVLLLFVCVVLHELGHSLMAMRYGVRVKDITLLPIGGVAQMRRMPAKPRQELLVALAGPAVNVVIAGLLGALVWGSYQGHLPSIFRLLRLALHPSVPGLVIYMLLANAGMALFNMLPAFPMDGGRVLRALLSMMVGNAKATAIAARVGQVLAVGFLLFSIYRFSPVLMLVGFFIFTGASGELRGAQVRRVLDSITAGQAVSLSTAPVLDPDQALGSITQLAIFNKEPDFPVMQDGRMLGLLHVAELNALMREHGPWAPVSAAMRSLPLSAKASDSLYDVEQLLAEAEADAVTVSDDNNGFLGVLTRQRIWAALRTAQGLGARV
ncbi:MAG TPA: site-2 protease family protein [Chloroflexota bacterium]|nr:site-2 protease family protein [Chloroflexota bacterium]